jgi:hypothetical protein
VCPSSFFHFTNSVAKCCDHCDDMRSLCPITETGLKDILCSKLQSSASRFMRKS